MFVKNISHCERQILNIFFKALPGILKEGIIYLFVQCSVMWEGNNTGSK